MEEDTPRSKLTCLGRHVGATHGEELGNREENPDQAQVFLPCMRGKVSFSVRVRAVWSRFFPACVEKSAALQLFVLRSFPTCLEKP